MCRRLEIELETQRRIARSRGLNAFHRNATTWELLLLLAANDGQSDLGVYNTLGQLETGYLGQSAMLKFLRDRRLDGLLAFDEHEKRSKWLLRLDPSIHEDLMELLAWRNQKLMATGDDEGFEAGTMDDKTRSHPVRANAGTRKR